MRRMIKTAQNEHRSSMTMIGRETAPPEGFLIILGQALPALGHLAELVLSLTIPLHGRKSIPINGVKIALRHSDPSFVSHSERVLVLRRSPLGVGEQILYF